VELFTESEVPWDEIAFPVVRETLGLYFEERRNGGLTQHCGDIVRLGGDIRRYRVDIHGTAV
jgi:hypothetical protein